ncbi:tryptophan 2,3-dioxygenase family protein [Alteromonadaceae bacterium BrNp21-10]|nr:tryptophan 2,3-dioxygenase family protein [Alteromonadaceae bacterium BrNp21-10]
MRKNQQPVNYADYLQLDKLLAAQQPESIKYGEEAHDETLFIIIHQVYELWFKQILHELMAVITVFKNSKVKDQELSLVVHRLERICVIQKLLNEQIQILETMTPQDFLSFRDYLIPASGFQSIQFKVLEITLGLKRQFRIEDDKQSFLSRLSNPQRAHLTELENQPSLFELVDDWLSRMPFLQMDDFDFWQLYSQATSTMLESDRMIIQTNNQLTEVERMKELAILDETADNFAALLDVEKYQVVLTTGQFRLSHKAMLAALFIKQYSEEPAFNLAHQLIQKLTQIDENLTLWRYRHAMMVQRMLGTKIGTGGSSGHDYLKRTTEANRIFTDFFNMSTFLLPKAVLPQLPESIRKKLGFYLS